MAGFNYQIGFDFAGLAELQATVVKFGELEKLVKSFNGGLLGAARGMRGFGNQGVSGVNSITQAVAGLAAKVGVAAFGLQSLQAGADMEGFRRTIDFASGGAIVGAKNIAFLDDTIKGLHMNKLAAYEGFKTLAAGMAGTGVSAGVMQDVFKGVAQATTVLGVNANDTKSAFLALSQMASKGTVSAQELKLQLGNALPGAASIAARAMHMTVGQFNDMMEKGNILASDFLPKLATELKNTFSGGVAGAISGAQANFNDFTTSIYDLKIAFGEQLLPVVIPFLKDFLIPAVYALGDFVGKVAAAVAWMWSYKDAICNVGINLGILTFPIWAVVGATYALTAGTAIYSGAAIFATGVTVAWTWAIYELGLAIINNQFTFFVAIAIAIAAAIYRAWQRCEEFRASMYALWGVIKQVGADAIHYIVSRIQGLIELIKGVFNWDYSQMSHGLHDAFLGDAKLYENVGQRYGDAFNVGWNDGIKDFRGPELKDGWGVMKFAGEASTDLPWGVRRLNPAADNKGGGVGKGGTEDGIKGINGGGKKQTTIHIHTVKIGENFTVRTENMKEGASETREIFMRNWVEMLNSAMQMQ